jgi:hypothetical protein
MRLMTADGRVAMALKRKRPDVARWRCVVSEPTRTDNGDCSQSASAIGEVAFDCRGVRQAVVWVIDEADERAAVGMSPVLSFVDDQMLHQFTLTETLPRHLGLDDEALGLQQEI